MDDRKTTEGRLALIGLTVLTVATLFVFAFLFLGAGDILFGDSPQEDDGGTVSSDDSSAPQGDLSAVISEVQGRMNHFQTQLASPYLILVNESTPLPEGYSVDLVPLQGEKRSDFQLEQAAAVHLNEFLAAAERTGYAASVTAAYRTERAQEKVYENAVKDYMNAGYTSDQAKSMASMKVGSVNRSEHQTGFAVDFSAKEMTTMGTSGLTFEEYLTANMHKYGFVLSYPAGEESKTEHEANTCHYRYVGIAAAQTMTEENWTLIEYRDYLQTQIDYLKQYIQSLEKK